MSVVFALSIPMAISTPAAEIGSTVSQPAAVMAELWEMPGDLATRDHRFSDNLAGFDRCLLEAISWMTQRSPR
jgi:hypothetical protein